MRRRSLWLGAGHSTWFIVLNAHAKRGTCPTTIAAPCSCPWKSLLVWRPMGLARSSDSSIDRLARLVHRTSPSTIGRGIGNALGFTGGRFSASKAGFGGRFSARREGDSAWISPECGSNATEDFSRLDRGWEHSGRPSCEVPENVTAGESDRLGSRGVSHPGRPCTPAAERAGTPS